MSTRSYSLIMKERARQREKWGVQNHSPEDWLMILMEEIGEFAEARMEAMYRGADPRHIQEELVQVAAVTVAMLECSIRNGWESGEPKPVCWMKQPEDKRGPRWRRECCYIMCPQLREEK